MTEGALRPLDLSAGCRPQPCGSQTAQRESQRQGGDRWGWGKTENRDGRKEVAGQAPSPSGSSSSLSEPSASGHYPQATGADTGGAGGDVVLAGSGSPALPRPHLPPPSPPHQPQSQEQSLSFSFTNTGRKLTQPLSCINRIKGCIISLEGLQIVQGTSERQCLAWFPYFKGC